MTAISIVSGIFSLTVSTEPNKATFGTSYPETGIDKYIYRSNVRAKKGVKVYSKIRGKKYERISIVAGKCGDKIVAPLTYKGTSDSALFEYWLKIVFVLKLPNI